MLDSDTKRRINTCRDILVGKVPDPKSQVEQITIALIYKFMDDMDLESEEMGGARTFFAGEFERYAWAKLVAPGVGGQEMLNTYTEALTKIVENPGIPELFRSIFRNAYLPYRDPETLRSFLREINGFTYDHSERLGDAFEYLLSVLGSQGDAGQFRTPRHIIDFMVELIDPRKDEVILDPACGTAGFLISSYKHILKANSTDTGSNGVGVEVDAAEATLDSPLRYSGDLLTPEDRLRLASNIKGYDISPDMVRLSLVNLYLHGFADPKVEEYDTLTSDDKWGETADVILANPPFMSPKGGIKPHNRFGIPSKRSEVLFVDYIAEHLSPKGRAAIVVPEGIIFQSQSAYCDLRRMLVDKFLAAVISLPAGVFNPYSGVKTSILILDRAVAKASDSIAFFKIENDGFGLGAQRRAVKGSQLPQVKAELGAWLEAVRGGGEAAVDSSLGFAIEKARVAEDGQFNLSGERYRETGTRQSTWPLVPLGEIARRSSGGTPSKENPAYWDGGIPWVSPKDMKFSIIEDTEDHISEEAIQASATSLVPAGTILCVVRSGILKHSFPVAITARPMCFNQDIVALASDPERLDHKFLFWSLKGRSAEILATGIKPGVTVQSFHSGFFKTFEIPLPPLEIQREIVAEIDGYQKVIDGARTVLENYRPHIPVDPAWPMTELGQIIERLDSGVSVNSENREAKPGEKGILKTSCVTSGVFEPMEHKAILPEEVERAKCSPKADSIIISRMNTEALVGASAYVDEDFPELYLPDRLWQTVITREDVSARYIHQVIASPAYRTKISAVCGGTSGSMKNISKPALLGIEVPLPPFETQQAIVAEIEAEQALVEANRELIARFEKKIEVAIARVWGGAVEGAT
jgi:type I restriction enzyme M protein